MSLSAKMKAKMSHLIKEIVVDKYSEEVIKSLHPLERKNQALSVRVDKGICFVDFQNYFSKLNLSTNVNVTDNL